MLKYLILFLFAAGFSLLLTPLVRSFAIRIKVLDLPGGRKIHTRPIPRLGGFSVFITFNLVLLASSQFAIFHFSPGFLKGIHFGWIFLASAIVLGLGAIDDFRRMPPAVKFLFQIMAGLIVAQMCSKIEVISLPFGTFRLGAFAVPATVFWVVAITNAVNLLDGLDGLAAGTCFIVCIAIFGISLLGQNIGIALVSAILAGSILGFLRYNFHPASIFLGDSGAYFLGFILSVLSLQGGLKGTASIAILIPIIALGLPIMDTALSMFRRLLKSLHIMEVDQEKNVVRFFYLDGWSMFKADRGHIHHRLMRIGFTQKKAVLFLYGVSIILGGLALSSVYFKNINYALLLTGIAFASYIGIRKLGYSEVQLLRNGLLLPLFDTPVVNRRIPWAFLDMGIISLSYYLAFLLRFEGDFSPVKNYYLSTLPLMLAAKIIIFHLAGLYLGEWRYTSVDDLVKVLKAVVLGCIASALLLWMIPGLGIVSHAALIIDFNLLLFFVVGARSSFRILEHLHISKNQKGTKVLIYGAGKRGVYALKEFINNPRSGLSPVGFIDDSPRYQGKQINSFPVLGTLDSLDSILANNSISEVILCREDLPKEKLNRLTEICSSHRISVRRFQTGFEDITSER
jgi:UDP-N-acetylmuramyl pentapeptide phosphotransferase/UDP-N-acetylglucosamine-1-phosphate transferase